jgi:MGT family glycosyltransferase
MTIQPRTYLFTVWEGGGTLPPELGVARRLVERGHRVHVLGDPTVAEQAAAAGCGFSPWKRAPHRTDLDPANDLLKDWEVSNPLAMLRNARDLFMAGPAAAFADDTSEVIDAVQPDVVVADVMILGSIIAAQGAGVPVAVLIPNIWMLPSPGVPPIGPGFRPARTPLGRLRDAAVQSMANKLFNGGLPALNAPRVARDLAPLDALFDQMLDVDRILVLTSAAFDLPAPEALPSNARYVGPILDDPQWAEAWESPWAADDERPLVLVGFSSTFQDQVQVLQRTVEALSAMPVRAVVTLGQMIEPGAVTGTENVAVVASAPHSELLREAAVVISHCGHGTTLRALAAGVPLVCMPMGRDQNDTAVRVVHRGAGVRIKPTASAAKIRSAAQRLLDEPALRAGAQRMAEAIAEERRHVDVVAELEALGAPARVREHS